MTFDFFRLLDHLVQDVTDRKSLQSTYDWTKRYCEKCSFTNPDLFKPAFDLYLKLNGKYKQGSSMLKDVSIKIRAELGNFNDSITVSWFQENSPKYFKFFVKMKCLSNSFQREESDTLFGFITEKTGEQVFAQMLAYLENLMDVTDMIIHRSKQLSTDLNIPHIMKRCLSEHEASLCNNFARVINAAKELVQTKFKSYEAVFKLLIRFYTSLDLLTKHFIIRFKTLKECVTTSRSVFKPATYLKTNA